MIPNRNTVISRDSLVLVPDPDSDYHHHRNGSGDSIKVKHNNNINSTNHNLDSNKEGNHLTNGITKNDNQVKL